MQDDDEDGEKEINSLMNEGEKLEIEKMANDRWNNNNSQSYLPSLISGKTYTLEKYPLLMTTNSQNIAFLFQIHL